MNWEEKIEELLRISNEKMEALAEKFKEQQEQKEKHEETV